MNVSELTKTKINTGWVQKQNLEKMRVISYFAVMLHAQYNIFRAGYVLFLGE